MNDVTRILSAIEQGDPQGGRAAPAAGLRRAAQAGRPEAGAGEARPDAPGHGPGPRGLPPAGRRRRGPAVGQPGPLLRRRGRGHAPHPRRQRPPQAAPKHGGGRERVELDEGDWLSRATPDEIARPRRGPGPARRGRRRVGRAGQAPFFAGLSHRGGRRGPRASRRAPPTATGLTPGPGSWPSGRAEATGPAAGPDDIFAESWTNPRRFRALQGDESPAEERRR